MTITVSLLGYELHLSFTRTTAEPERPPLEAAPGGWFERAEPLWTATEEFGFSARRDT